MSNMAYSYRSLTYAEMRNQNLFTDAVIKSTSGRERNIHKVVMSRTGRFFSNAFTFPTFSGTLDLAVSDEVAQVIIDMAYEGICSVDAEKVLEILSAALMYQMESLIEICVTFVLNNASSLENIVDLKVFVREHRVALETFTDGALMQTVDKFIRRNFIDLYERDDIYNLSVKELEADVKEDDLNIAEEELLDFVLKYVAFHQLNNEKARKLLACVRIALIDPTKLQHIADENETFRTEMETRGEVKASHLPRHPRDIVLVNGECGMEMFNVRKNEWKKVQIDGISPDVILGNILYEIDFLDGGLTKIKSFDIKNGHLMTEKTSQLPNNTSDLGDIFLLTWNGGILVHMGNHAVYYNTAENSWEPFPYSGGVVVSVTNGKLISIGYEGGENGLGYVIKYLDKGTMTWILCGHLKKNHSTDISAFVVDGKVYVFSMREKYAECFQPVWEEGRIKLVWFPNIQLPFIYVKAAAEVVDNKILLTRELKFENGDFNRWECHIFSPKTGEWSRVADFRGTRNSQNYLDCNTIIINTSEFEVNRIQQICDGHFSSPP